MNRNRTDFKFTDGHQIQITSNWLHGFIEGEGTFSVKQDKQAYKGNLALRFFIYQSDEDIALLEAIKSFLINLPAAKQSGLSNDSFVKISVFKKRKDHYKNGAVLGVTHFKFIKNVLIPLFDSMTWFSQKQLDYESWKNIILLKEKGQHYTEEGFNLIKLIINQMNKGQLSSSGIAHVDRGLLNNNIKLMVAKRSVYENKNDRIWIKSENRYQNAGGVSKEVQMIDTKGNPLKIFKSNSEAAKFLNVSRTTIIE